ncbi:cytosine-specific methyltransferase [Glycocaulis albus]|uniref:Cytosine-specific methyltransferase n=1 Tax=Glycocaulis albus TaxID=1382801 RepID=A0ABQ1XE89_9PROT|nr:DNA cytosine methyltransferase [Glycocaulis albus]GGG92078.1 cytosine-specific methyltransferase [Glycocaulis albus]
MASKYTAIDLFCGAGGLSEGLRQAGFHVLAGNDYDAAAGATFAHTHREAKFLPGPIQDIDAEDFLRAAGLRRGELDCLVGGPPCQAFSVYNHKRGMHDARSQLFHEYLRLVDGLHPRWVVMENVTGILSAGNGAAVDAIIDGLKKLGYSNVEHRTLKAEEYGVPQERRRVVFIANRVGAPIIWPEPTHGPGRLPFNTIKDAIGDLPLLENGEDQGVTNYAAEPCSHFQYLVRDGSNGVLNHAAPRLSSINIERMRHIPPGGSWRDIPFELLPNGMKKARRCDHTKRYGRMKWDGLSCTVLTKCDVHWGAYIHPEQNRSISVREAARLQSFPDWFEFLGSKTEQYVQVGNAVPPLLGRCIGEAILKADAYFGSTEKLVAAE